MKLSKVFGIVLSLHVGVILLVMFQPSCQTTGGTAKVPESEQSAVSSEPSEQSFNQAIEGVDQPLEETKAEETKTEEFAAPKRPSPGELIVPQEPASTPPSPSIIVPSEEIAPLPIDLKPSDLAIYKVVRGDTLWGIARKNGVSLANLLNANPNLDKSGRLSIGQEIMIPGMTESTQTNLSTEVVENTPSPSLDGRSYTVNKGDTLSRIARNLKVRLSELLKANGMSMSSIIRPGQVLVVPGNGSGQPVESVQAVENPPRVVPSGATTHIVKKGENLSRISSIYGVSMAQIMEWNGLSNPSLIRAGQPLVVSQGEGIGSNDNATPALKNESAIVPVEEGGSLQDFFNDSSSEDRPIIDAP